MASSMTQPKISPHMMCPHQKTGRDVVEQEAAALLMLAQALDDQFSRAVELIQSIKGRLIVSGMGKSGHIARKIAATLASTGQPAFFVHAGEASHGDLGMLTPDDGVVLLSFSGTTHELHPIIAYTHRFNIPTIGITKNIDSPLAQRVTVPLILPDVTEACPLDLAPTTSTTMMLALGDALAISLLKSRNFSPQDYGLFHPGGSLGEKLTTVGDRMHRGRELPLKYTHDSLPDIVQTMTDKGFGCVGITNDNGALVGVITDGDLRRLMMRGQHEGHWSHHTGCDIMTASPKTVTPDILMADALRILQEKAITSLFIVDDGMRPIGLIHIHDLLKRGII